MTNWKSRGLEKQEHGSSFPASLLSEHSMSHSNRCTPVHCAVKHKARKIPDDFRDCQDI